MTHEISIIQIGRWFRWRCTCRAGSRIGKSRALAAGHAHQHVVMKLRAFVDGRERQAAGRLR